MRRALLAAMMALSGCGAPTPSNSAVLTDVAASPEAVTLTASDGVRVFGHAYRTPDPKAVILLFHQAGSSKDEYATIAPRLVNRGYTVLAIDQRSGHRMFGPNQTAEALGDKRPDPGSDGGYVTTLPDLRAALDWGVRQGAPVILWGSSYSSSLIFRLAADNPGKVKALVAFSPAEYFAEPTLVRTAAAKLDLPVFVATSGSDGERARAKEVTGVMKAGNVTEFVPRGGVHGSSLLIAARNADGAAAAWQAVTAFLDKVTQ